MTPRFRSTWDSLLRAWDGITEPWRDGDRVPRVAADLPETDADRVRQLMSACLEARGGEVSARQRAAVLGELYLTLDDHGRLRFLETLANSFCVDRETVKTEARQLLEAVDDESFRQTAGRLREALLPPQQRLLRQFNDLPQGVKFLIDLRADLLRFLPLAPQLKSLDRDLRQLLATWFDVGFLTAERITWESPAALLEKLIGYEAVHAINSWSDLHNRLVSDRHCYAFFHPAMPNEPLIFIEVALVEGLATSIQTLLDETAPDIAPDNADTAIFYSISNTQQGLQGISFGPFLIKQVARSLQQELPNLKTFSTLSPIPGFRRWLSSYLDAVTEQDPEEPLQTLLEEAHRQLDVPAELAAVMDHPQWHQRTELAGLFKEPLLKLCCRYLHERRDKDQAPLDPVARFHLGNGARIEQIDWLGDTSAKGMRESCGLMVNYRYQLKEIEKNIEAYAGEQQIAASSRVKTLLKNADEDERNRLAGLTKILVKRTEVEAP
jgi:malonyl-CoA decarboxylase